MAGIACTHISDETYVAFSSSEASLVTLHRLVWSLPTPNHGVCKHQKTFRTFQKPWRLLFRGDLLQVSDWKSTTRSHAIVPLRASGGELSENRALLAASAENRIDVRAWALAGDRLVLWDKNSRDLLIYAIA